MAGIDDVMARLIGDAAFRAELARDPRAALEGYDLRRGDIELLASRLDDGDDAQRAVEQRTSKSALLGMLSLLGDGGDPAVPGVGQDETLSVGGNRAGSVGDEVTKVPGPPAPPVPTPYPNTADAEVGMESLELSAEGLEVEQAAHEATHVVQGAGDAHAAAGSENWRANAFRIEMGSMDSGDADAATGASPVGATPPDDTSPVMGVTPDDGSPVMGVTPDDSMPRGQELTGESQGSGDGSDTDATGPVKYGDITLKRGVTGDDAVVDDLATPGDDGTETAYVKSDEAIGTSTATDGGGIEPITVEDLETAATKDAAAVEDDVFEIGDA